MERSRVALFAPLMMIIGCERISGVPNKVSRVRVDDIVCIKIGMGRPEASEWSGLWNSRAPEKMVESHQQTVALPLLNHNNHNKHDNNASKDDEDEFAGLLGSKVSPENTSAMLIPDRIYKENRMNWNVNYQQPENLKHGNANWSLPAWNEPSSRMWNQSNQSSQMKNSRKVSAKQHYLSVARYVAGQSTNLPSRNGDSDINRSKLLLNGFIGQTTSNKYEDFAESYWESRNSIENQTRQHYLARNRYIAEQNLRLPYPSVYGTQNIKTTNKPTFQPNLFGNVFNAKASGGPYGRTDWAAKYLK
ncbi:hypothetical protein EAG_09334 [Camponotus floridanus]|uniref:Uncharacterized protein n=1 Tax=Camponotus floridanus TaxID=104421 RepID=E2ABL2_CAMFO|nr:hypothetical protein EAG_09334 [Camponotus floridanus]